MSEALHDALGAGPPAGVEQVTLFIPSVDRDGQPIDQAYWTDQAITTFGTLFRGATSFPPGRGVWRDDERGGVLVYDDTQMVIFYVSGAILRDDEVLKLSGGSYAVWAVSPTRARSASSSTEVTSG
jgi:hypothetical protein